MERTAAYRTFPGLVAALLLVAGCVGPRVIPDSVYQDIDRNVSFGEVLSNPEAHAGSVVALGGVVLSARNLKDGTEIEVLEIPLDRYDRPSGPASDSEGRFLVMYPGYLETATLTNGRRITVVGEVTGSEVRPIDEAEYRYPYLKSRFLHVWTERIRYGGYPYPYDPYPYYPWPYRPPGYYYPWYPYDPWGPPVIIAPDENRHPKRRLDPSGGAPPPSKGNRRQID